MKLTLKQARAGKFTQKEMAEALGVSTITYSNWERKPIEQLPYGKVKEIAEKTGVALSDLGG